MKRILIVGSGAHGRIVAETITLAGGWEIAGFGDDDPKKSQREIAQWRIHLHWRELAVDAYVVAIGINTARERIFSELEKTGRELAAVIHPKAFISPGARIGSGTVILAGAVVSLGVQVGKNAIINVGAVVDHDAVVQDHAHVAQNATIASFGRVEPFEHVLPGTVRVRP